MLIRDTEIEVVFKLIRTGMSLVRINMDTESELLAEPNDTARHITYGILAMIPNILILFPCILEPTLQLSLFYVFKIMFTEIFEFSEIPHCATDPDTMKLIC
jgi:hypothetical protein